MKELKLVHSTTNETLEQGLARITTYSSLFIANYLDKKHSQILKAIRKYIAQNKENGVNESLYMDTKGRKQPVFELHVTDCFMMGHYFINHCGDKGFKFGLVIVDGMSFLNDVHKSLTGEDKLEECFEKFICDQKTSKAFDEGT